MPESLNFDNYAAAYKKLDLGTTFVNTLFYTVTSVIILALLCGMATLVIMQSFQIWNDYLSASLYVSKKQLKTLTVAIQSLFSAQSSDYTTAMAAIVISVLPIAVLFLSLQKYFIKGMTVGAVKG